MISRMGLNFDQMKKQKIKGFWLVGLVCKKNGHYQDFTLSRLHSANGPIFKPTAHLLVRKLWSLFCLCVDLLSVVWCLGVVQTFSTILVSSSGEMNFSHSWVPRGKSRSASSATTIASNHDNWVLLMVVTKNEPPEQKRGTLEWVIVQ